MENSLDVENIFGKWNASLFYIARKKCLIFVNSKSFYSVIIPKFSISELGKIDQLFLENFYQQLIFEKIDVDLEFIVKNIGKLSFHHTDNDRKITGIINYHISNVDYLKYDYEIFNSAVIRELTNKLNLIPFKQLGWKNPNVVMNEILKSD
nr:hypothetical protein [Lutibacter citreus]